MRQSARRCGPAGELNMAIFAYCFVSWRPTHSLAFEVLLDMWHGRGS
jgi:hypothetical protein